MKGKPANIDHAALEMVWFDRTVSMHDIALQNRCSLETVRNAAKAAGLPLRSTIMPPHPPLWEDYQNADALEEEVKRRAALVRETWSEEDEYRRRVSTGRVEFSLLCVTNSGDASTFTPTSVPGYMMEPLRTEEELYRDRREGNAA
jgi:hypothetical protein